MINRWYTEIQQKHTWLLSGNLGLNTPNAYVCPAALNTSTPNLYLCICCTQTRRHTPSLLILPACIPWCLLLKVKCYSRSKVTINMAKIVSLSFPPGPDTENNFPFSLASADTGVNEDIQPPGSAACSRLPLLSAHIY